MDRIYRDTPSARIDRLIPIWKQLSDGRLHAAASRYIEQPSHSRLQNGRLAGQKTTTRSSCLTASSRSYLAGGTILHFKFATMDFRESGFSQSMAYFLTLQIKRLGGNIPEHEKKVNFPQVILHLLQKSKKK